MCFFPQRTLSLVVILICISAASAFAQSSSPPLPVITDNGSKEITIKDSGIDEIRRQLREQREEIEILRAALAEQSRTIKEMRECLSSPLGAVHAAPSDATAVQNNLLEERQSNVEAKAKETSDSLTSRLGSINFSGELRLQYDSFYGQLNALPNAANLAIVGNELSPRHRGRFRARFAVRGQFGKEVFIGNYDQSGKPRKGKEFDWGLRLSSGSLANVVSSNQVLTDFYNRKPFALDQAFVGWRPRFAPGLRLQAGKFDTPWMRTELTIDNDLQPEGLSQTYSRDFKHSDLKNVTLVAWQLPFLERNSAFVGRPDGTVNLEESRRGGRDLALYGAQVQTKIRLRPKLDLTLSASDLYFSGTQFITPIQFIGNQLQLPVTITIPATGASPSQTVTGVATIPRELLVAGNGNLGLSIATTNATNRDGRLASGFNLVDMIGRLDIKLNERYPMTVIFDFVKNTQAHDVIVASQNGRNLVFPNDEDSGYWAEFQIRRLRMRERDEKIDTPKRGDISFGYTFMRIEKDAVLTPFNFDDLVQFSDVRAHRFAFTYAADQRVTFNFIGIVNQRPNGLLGPFGQTPPGSPNRPTLRIQFDTIYRF